MKNRSLLMAVSSLVLASVLAACSGTKAPEKAPATGDQAKPVSKLVVAIDATYPPMEFIDEKDGKTPIGFDVDLAKALGKEMGVPVEFKVVDWNSIIPGLQAKQYDAIISSMNITPERAKEVNFIEYVKMSQVFVSPKGGTQVTKDTELSGKTVAVQDGTTSHDYMKDLMANKVKDVKALTTFPGATDSFMALKAKQADVIVVDEPVGLYYASKDSASFAITGRAIEPEPVGIALRKDDAALKAALEKALATVKSNGKFKEINTTWFGSVELGK
jgi:polar amino acid transport system substrate-binding protein